MHTQRITGKRPQIRFVCALCDLTPCFRAILLPLVLLLLCGPLQAGQYKGFPRGHALVTAAEVKSMLDGQGGKPVVLPR